MTSENQARDPFSWVDALGVASFLLTTVGAGVVFGFGWALLTAGVVSGAVFIYLEVILNPRRLISDRRRR